MLVLSTPRDLENLLHPETGRRARSKETIRLDLPGLAAHEAESWQSRLNAHRSDCGCSTGAVFTVAALIAVVVRVAVTASYAPPYEALWAAGLGLPFVLFSALAGKLTGLYVARLRFRRAGAQLLRHLTQLGATRPPETGGPDVEMHAVGR